MSSMVRASAFVLLLGSALSSVPAKCQDGPSYPPNTVSIPVVQGTSSAPQPVGSTAGSEWDQARARLIQSQRGGIGQAIDRWNLLSTSDRFGFADYSSFILSYPGYPEEEKLRAYAELALNRETVDPQRLVAFFDRYPPVTNPARAQYALALAQLRRPEASRVALDAWRGGPMSDAAESYIFATYAGQITPADHDQRMDALLWAGQSAQAQRQGTYVSPEKRTDYYSRLGMINGAAPGTLGLPTSGESLRDIGYIYNRATQMRRSGDNSGAAQLLATRPSATRPARDATKWVGLLLTVARGADAGTAVRIASSIDDAFAPNADVSRMGFKLRDDYTSLMWLGGTQALWQLGDPARAAPLFYRYGAAAQTPQTRSKGFYWAGRALAQRGDTTSANRYFEMAAAYPDHFYGMLALERLGRSLPSFDRAPAVTPSRAERQAFMSRPITAAVTEVARGGEWRTTVRFFREIADQAESESDYQLVADLAQSLGRRDLGVILGQEARTGGFTAFQRTSFPLIPTPPGANWTMVHAITRQESQFAMNAVSHAGARGLMQLMPGTAREQAGKVGLSYEPQNLTTDALYNLKLGDAYFGRMMDYFGGNHALAVGAYNAGPGNVNKWLRSNGDPRSGGVDWITWIEKIPLSETRNYIQRVLENAVVYESMNPQRASAGGGQNPLSRFLGKRDPG
jgi:soluble lytic murein transglycosylase